MLTRSRTARLFTELCGNVYDGSAGITLSSLQPDGTLRSSLLVLYAVRAGVRRGVYVRACVRVCACVRECMRVRACVRACVRVCVSFQFLLSEIKLYVCVSSVSLLEV